MAEPARFSPSAGWDDVRAMLRSESQIVVAIAGVFFLLPTIALSLLLPEIDGTAGLGPIVETLAPYAPLLIAMSLVQMVGQLALLQLIFADGRPTVGEAILGGLKLTPFYFVITLCTSLLIVLGFALLILPGLFLFSRLYPIGPVVVAEGQRWPAGAIARTFALTRGNGLTIFGFFLIVWIVFIILSSGVTLVFGTLLPLAGLPTASGDIGALAIAVIDGLLSAAGTAVFTLMQAAVYRQLISGRTSDVFV